MVGRVFVPRRAPRKRSPEEKFEGGLTKRSKHREKEKKKRKRERFTSYFYDWPPHKHSLSYGLFALPKLGFRGALSAIHHLNVSTETRSLGWQGIALFFPVLFFSSLALFLDARTFHGLLQMMARSSFSSFCTRIEDVSCTKVH